MPILLATCLYSGVGSAAPDARTPAMAPYQPKLFFGTVNFNDQLAKNPDQWRQTAARVEGMLLHIHFFVRRMNTPGNQKIEGADETIRQLAPSLKNKANLLELTYDINGVKSSPEGIAQDHAR